MYKFEVRLDPQTGLPTVYTMPGRCDPEYAAGVQRQLDQPERLQRSRRARGPLLRAGQQRRLHPAQGRRLRAARRCVLLAPWFTRFDIGVTKKIPIGGRKNFELRADVLNVFNNINFTVTDDSRTPGTGAGFSRPIAAYRDLDNTYDPGGRLGQLAIRFNW